MINYYLIREKLPEEQGGIFVGSLTKDESWQMNRKHYKVKSVTDKGIRIQESDLHGGTKTSTLTILQTKSVFYGNSRVEQFFRNLEGELTLDLINEHNRFHEPGFVIRKVSETLSNQN